jgi:hypothetical protein
MDMEAASDNSSVEDKGTRCQECQASAATHGLKVDAIERWCFECSKDHELAVNLQPAPGFLAEKELREQRKQRCACVSSSGSPAPFRAIFRAIFLTVFACI